MNKHRMLNLALAVALASVTTLIMTVFGTADIGALSAGFIVMVVLWFLVLDRLVRLRFDGAQRAPDGKGRGSR